MRNSSSVRRRTKATLLSATLSVLSIAACGGNAVAEPKELKAVVTIKPVHSLVARVMEGVGTPELLVKGAASPHTYSLKTSDARSLNAATVFFRVSEQVEPFTGKIVKSLPKSVKVVTLAEASGLELLDKRTGNTFEHHDHADDHGHGKKSGHSDHKDHDHEKDEHQDAAIKDGHIWLDPRNAKAIVDQVAQVLVTAAPQHAERLKANAVKLLADLDALEKEIADSLEPIKRRPFIVFHDALQYFERRFGLAAAGSITISPEVRPSAKRLTEVRTKISGLGATCVFAEPQFSPNLVATVTEGTRARSGTLDPEGLSIKDGSEAYFSLMRGLATGLRGCLSQSS